MKRRLWIRKTLSVCSSIALLVVYSSFALAVPSKTAGELVVFGKSQNGEAPFVFVNGEPSKSGRSIFSSSTLTTPETATAIINMGRLGKIELAPGSNFVLTVDDSGISGDLTAGKLTVIGSSGVVTVKTLDGNLVKLTAGRSVTAAGRAQDDDDDDDWGGAAWWGLAAVFAGAGAIIIWAATREDRIRLGDEGTVVSPNR